MNWNSFKLNELQLTIFPVYLVVAVDTFGLTLVIPIAVAYAKSLGAEKSVIGLLFTAYSIGAFTSSLIIGRISDLFGRRNVFLWTLFGAFLSFIGSACAQTFPQYAFWRFLAGIFTGTTGNAMAYITDVVPHDITPKYISYVSAVISSCFVIGPILGGSLTTFGIRTPFYCAATIAFVGLLMVFFYIQNPEKLKEQINPKESQSKKSVSSLSTKYYQADNHDRTESESDRLVSTESEIDQIKHEDAVSKNNNSTPGLSSSDQNTNQILQEQRNVSPFLHPGALIVGGLGTFLNTVAYAGLSILVPLFLMEPSFGIVSHSTDDETQVTDRDRLTSLENHQITLLVGSNLGIFGLTQALCMIYLFPYLTQNLGILSTGSLGAGIIGSSFLFFQIACKEWQLILIYMGLAVGNGILRPMLSSYLGMIAPTHRHGEYLAITTTFATLAMMISGYLSQIYIYDSKWDVILLVAIGSFVNSFSIFAYRCYLVYGIV